MAEMFESFVFFFFLLSLFLLILVSLLVSSLLFLFLCFILSHHSPPLPPSLSVSFSFIILFLSLCFILSHHSPYAPSIYPLFSFSCKSLSTHVNPLIMSGNIYIFLFFSSLSSFLHNNPPFMYPTYPVHCSPHFFFFTCIYRSIYKALIEDFIYLIKSDYPKPFSNLAPKPIYFSSPESQTICRFLSTFFEI